MSIPYLIWRGSDKDPGFTPHLKEPGLGQTLYCSTSNYITYSHCTGNFTDFWKTCTHRKVTCLYCVLQAIGHLNCQVHFCFTFNRNL